MSLNLNEVALFEVEQKIIEYQVAQEIPLASLKVDGFGEVLASDAPAPGGGSVAALAASMAAGLASMVAALTFGKKGYTEHDEAMEQVGVRAQKLKDRLLQAMDDDTAAFDKVMDCFRLPKKTDEDKAARQAAITEANKGATLIPLSVLEACPDVLELVAQVEQLGNQNSLSDAGVGGLMARAGAYGAFYNVLINLQAIEDKPWCEEIRQRADAAVARVDELARPIQDSVLGKLR